MSGHPDWIPDDVAEIVETTIGIYRRRNQTEHLCAAAIDDVTLRWKLADGTMVDVGAPARTGRKVTVTHLDGTAAKTSAAVRGTLDEVWHLYRQKLDTGELEPRHVAAAIGAATHTLRNRDAGLVASGAEPATQPAAA